MITKLFLQIYLHLHVIRRRIALVIDDMAEHDSITGKGCHSDFTCLSVILYAVYYYVSNFRLAKCNSVVIEYACDDELYNLNLFIINSLKSKSIRFGTR